MKYILLSACLTIVFCACAQPVKMIKNPYENVDWKNTNRYKANFHMHTTNSDGSLTANYVVDTYAQNNYKIIMITDHDILTWPWTKFSKIKPDWKDRKPDSMKVLTFPAIELDDPHHRGVFFARIPGGINNLDTLFKQIQDSSALTIFNHPGRYWKIKKKYTGNEEFSPEWYVEYFKKYPAIVGMEVYNRPNDGYPYDRILWDEILSRTMPKRPVWGFADDDMHGQKQMMGNYEFMLMPELTVPALKTAMKTGAFYASNEPEHSGKALAPRVDSIKVDQKKAEIKIYAHDYKTILWFSGVAGADSARKSNVVGEGDLFKYGKFDKSYVRFELKNDKGTTISQPFGFSNSMK